MGAERIRVAHVITRMIVGGAQETVLLAAALADRSRFAPVVVCGPQTGSEGSLHDEVRRRGVELVVVPELVRQVSPLTDLRSVPALGRVLQDRRVDLVHTNSSKAGIVGRLAARRANLPAVHTVHGWPFHDHQPVPVSMVWRELERRAARFTQRLVVVAESDREKGLAAGIGSPQQYVTVRSGLELAHYDCTRAARAEVRRELGVPLDAPVVGAVNRLSPQKDPLTLVEAFAVVRRRLPAARLLVVGDGPLRAVVEDRVRGLGLCDAVVLTGLRDDVPRLIQAMDVFASASRWEGLPRTVIAAMATGVPVVATLADGIRDVVQDGVTGRAVPVGRPDLLSAAVAYVLAGGGASYVEAAARRLAEFDATTMSRRLEALYDEVLAQ